MLLESRLQLLVNTRQVEAIKAEEEKLAQKVATYVQNADTLIKVVEAVPLLRDLGFDLERIAALSEVPDPVPSEVEIKAEATIQGQPLLTTLAYEPKSNYHGPRVVLTVESAAHNVRERDTTPVGIENIEESVVALVANSLDKIAEREKNLAAYARKQARKRELVPAFVAAASRFLAIWEKYEREHSAWFATEQARIWQPWSAYEIRIVPMGRRTENEDDDIGVETLVILEHPLEIAAQLQQQPMAEVTVVTSGGQTRREWIGGLLRATPMRFDKPGYGYHRRFPVRDHWNNDEYIYGSPLIDAQAAPAPVKPDYWSDWLSDNKPVATDEQLKGNAYNELYDYFRRRNPHDLVMLTPETFED